MNNVEIPESVERGQAAARLTVDPGDGDALEQTDPEQSHAARRVVVEQLEDVHAALQATNRARSHIPPCTERELTTSQTEQTCNRLMKLVQFDGEDIFVFRKRASWCPWRVHSLVGEKLPAYMCNAHTCLAGQKNFLREAQSSTLGHKTHGHERNLAWFAQIRVANREASRGPSKRKWTYPGHHGEPDQVGHAAVDRQENLPVPVLPQDRKEIHHNRRESLNPHELKKHKIVAHETRMFLGRS